MRDFHLSFGQVERILMRLHGVSEKRRVTLRTRLQNLQRLDFPPGVASGQRGRKVAYRADQFFRLVFVLEFAAARIPPAHAVRIVETGWTTLRLFVDEAILRHDGGVFEETAPSDRWCVVAGRGLDMLGSDEGEDAVEPVQLVFASVVDGWMMGEARAPEGPMIMLDLLRAAGRALAMVDGALSGDGSEKMDMHEE